MNNQAVTVAMDPTVSTMAVGNSIPMENHIVTVTVLVQNPTSAVTVDDFIWMGNLWLNAVAVMVATFTLFAVILGIFGWRGYREWEKGIGSKVEKIGKKAGQDAIEDWIADTKKEGEAVEDWIADPKKQGKENE